MIKVTYLFTIMNRYKRVLRDTERYLCTNFILTYVKESSKWLKRQRMSAGVRTHPNEVIT